jgi:hypothetical protein
MNSTIEKKLHAQSTAPERRLWRLLHPLRTGGYHFRKQEQIGPFYVDFACSAGARTPTPLIPPHKGQGDDGAATFAASDFSERL